MNRLDKTYQWLKGKIQRTVAIFKFDRKNKNRFVLPRNNFLLSKLIKTPIFTFGSKLCLYYNT